jgi:hypothetical protein
LATNNHVSYVNYDYDDLVVELTNRLKANNVWKDTYESSTGQMWIEFFAVIANLILYYVERRAEECFIGTAQNKSSVVNLARLVNYTPRRTVSAIGTLTFTIPVDLTVRISIRQYTKCLTANSVEFLTMQDVTIEPGQLSNSVAAIEGELVELDLVGDGTLDREIAINDTFVENDDHPAYKPFSAFRVLVDGEEWTKVTSFLDSAPADTHYVVRAELNDTLTIIFGDDIHGKVVKTGSTISVKYIRSTGTAGNVYETAKVITIADTLYDANGVEITNITVSNTTVMIGGDDAESMEQVRLNAPSVFATGDRLVTKADFSNFILAYESVADVNVWGEAEETPPNYAMFNRVKICMLLDDWVLPPSLFKQQLATNLYDKSMLTVKYEFITAVILYVIVELDVFVNAGYSLSQTQADIATALADNFTLGTTSKLGLSKYKSNLVQAIDELTSIDHHHLTMVIRKEIAQSTGSSDTYVGVLDAFPIKRNTVQVYVIQASNQETLFVGEDNGLGLIVNQGSNHIASGTIDYATGDISMDITDTGDIQTVYVLYEQDEEGDVIVDNQQICKLYSTQIDSITYSS